MINFPDLNHPILGLLKYNDKYDWYEGNLIFQDRSIELSVTANNKTTIESILEPIDGFVDRLEHYTETAKDYAVEKLLELKNDVWLDEDEKPLTPTQFKVRMLIKSIGISPDSSICFNYDDSELFAGHEIFVTMDSSNRFIDAGI
jgi:hypothetical protein